MDEVSGLNWLGVGGMISVGSSEESAGFVLASASAFFLVLSGVLIVLVLEAPVARAEAESQAKSIKSTIVGDEAKKSGSAGVLCKLRHRKEPSMHLF